MNKRTRSNPDANTDIIANAITDVLMDTSPFRDNLYPNSAYPNGTISDSQLKLQKKAVNIALRYLGITIFTAVFGAVYEYFSFGVYSFFMIYAFLFPLLGGTLPYLICAASGIRLMPDSISRSLFHAGIAALTLGSIITGIIEIYGSTNHLTQVYWLAGGLLIGAGLITHAFDK